MVIEPVKLNEKEINNRHELAYEWVARYNDGIELKQYDDKEQVVHQFGEIDQDKIYEFELVPQRDNLFPVKVNLETGLFTIDNKPFIELYQGGKKIPLGLDLVGKEVNSPWGNKAKLIYNRHMRRDFVPNESGFGMQVSVIFEIGWEATVNNEHEKYLLEVDEQGRLGIPATFEQQGFKAL